MPTKKPRGPYNVAHRSERLPQRPRMTPEMLALLKQILAERDLSLSDWLEEKINEEVARRLVQSK